MGLPSYDPSAIPPLERAVLSDTEFSKFRKLFQEQIGIHLPDQKKNLVVARLTRRLETLGLRSFGEYFQVVASVDGSEELQRAIDLITTNETSFFRENEHFRILVDRILPSLGAEAKVRIWCGAAATGEEPYSLAMVLAHHLGMDTWKLLATDVNSQVIAHARRAIYSMERAGTIPKEYLKAYCLRGTGSQEGMFRMDEPVRSRVNLRRMNLLSIDADLVDLDVVFLRNVLIYFDNPTRGRILTRIWERLRPGGWLVVGHSESTLGLDLPPLEQIRPSVYRKPSKDGSDAHNRPHRR